jgi:hypothetical protein
MRRGLADIGVFSALRQTSGATQGGGGTPIQPQGLQYVDPKINGIDWSFYPTNLPSGVVLGNNTHSAAVANATVATTQIQVTAAYDFYWSATTFQADNGNDNWQGAGTTGAAGYYPLQPLVTVLMNDSASQRNLMQAPVPIGELAGTAMNPYRLVMPRVFRATSTIVFTFTYYGPLGSSAANCYYENIYLTLHGFQVPAGQPLTFV